MKKLLFLFLLQIPSVHLGGSERFVEVVLNPIKRFFVVKHTSNEEIKGEGYEEIKKLIKGIFTKKVDCNKSIFHRDKFTTEEYSPEDLQFLCFCFSLMKHLQYQLYLGNLRDSRNLTRSIDGSRICFGINKNGEYSFLEIGLDSKFLPLTYTDSISGKHYAKLFLDKAKTVSSSEPYAVRKLFKLCYLLECVESNLFFYTHSYAYESQLAYSGIQFDDMRFLRFCLKVDPLIPVGSKPLSSYIDPKLLCTNSEDQDSGNLSGDEITCLKEFFERKNDFKNSIDKKNISNSDLRLKFIMELFDDYNELIDTIKKIKEGR